jgi:TrmH family RNA methyltransferase
MLTGGEEKEIRALRRRKGRDSLGRFLAEGVRLVEDLVASDLTVRLLAASSSLEDSDRGRALVRGAREAGIPVREIADAELERLAATETPQGVLAVAETPQWTFEQLRGEAPELILVLDAVQDPGNVGTLARSAEAFGAAGLIALSGTADPWNPKAVRSSAGSLFRLPVIAADWGRARDWLRSRSYQILAASAAGAPIGPSGERVALVVGNEGSGISRIVAADADGMVGIPQRGRADSLNVAAAAAILMYELTR